MNVVICGLPMSGKTVIGKMLADALFWEFIDTDRLIEKAYTKQTGNHSSCREIFGLEGEAGFRALERRQIQSLASASGSIIALGGGTLCDPDNVTIVRQIGTVVYLKASPVTLWKRVSERGIPAYLDPKDPENDFYTLAKRRIPLYEAAATITVDTEGLDKEDIVKEIIKRKDGK